MLPLIHAYNQCYVEARYKTPDIRVLWQNEIVANRDVFAIISEVQLFTEIMGWSIICYLLSHKK